MSCRENPLGQGVFYAGACFEIIGKYGATLKEQLDNFPQALEGHWNGHPTAETRFMG